MKGLDAIDWDELRIRSERMGDIGLWYLVRFLALRDDHSNDLPAADVRDLPRSDPRYDKFKCQGNYIAGLFADLRGAVYDRVIKDQALKHRIATFCGHPFRYKSREFTAPLEIDMINSVLDDVIEYLQTGRC